MDEPRDEELMIRYQQGSAADFDLLYARYEPRIYGYLLRIVGDRVTAADLFQETFLHLHRGRHNYDAGKPFGAWIFRIARNLAFNDLRRSQCRTPLLTDSADTDAQATADNPEESFTKKTKTQQLETALESLAEDQREAILLSYFGGLKYRDIAQLTATTEDAIKQRVRRGMAALCGKLKPFLTE